MKYKVIVYFSEIYEVEAQSEDEARYKAHEQLKNLNTVPIPDGYDVECLEDEE